MRKALTAAYVQDRLGIEDALTEAVEYWPEDPEINEFAENLLSKTDLQDMASMDFDRLFGRRITGQFLTNVFVLRQLWLLI